MLPRVVFQGNRQLLDISRSFSGFPIVNKLWNFASTASFPGTIRCLNLPWGLSHPEIGFFLSLGSKLMVHFPSWTSYSGR